MSLYPKAEKIIKDFIFMLIGEHKKRIILFLYFSLYSIWKINCLQRIHKQWQTNTHYIVLDLFDISHLYSS